MPDRGHNTSTKTLNLLDISNLKNVLSTLYVRKTLFKIILGIFFLFVNRFAVLAVLGTLVL